MRQSSHQTHQELTTPNGIKDNIHVNLDLTLTIAKVVNPLGNLFEKLSVGCIQLKVEG